MTRTKLEYGRARKVAWRPWAKRLTLATMGVAALVAGAWYTVWRVERLERDRLQRYFEAMPGVSSVYVDGYSEDLHLDYGVTGVAVWLEQPADGFIWFDANTVRELREDGEIHIGGIGPLSFEQTFQRSPYGQSGSGSIGIGPRGEFAGRIPFKINSAADVVANYDRLIAALEALPSTGTVTQADGNTYTYTITSDR